MSAVASTSSAAAPAVCRRLVGRSALVTAATAGIGEAIAERLAREGARVFICSRRAANVAATLGRLRAAGLEVDGCACHVGKTAELRALVAAAVARYGWLDILVSNAAVNPAAGPVAATPDGVWSKLFDVNVRASAALVREAAPHLAPGAAVVFVSSVTAFAPPAPIGAYAVSKTALRGLTKARARAADWGGRLAGWRAGVWGFRVCPPLRTAAPPRPPRNARSSALPHAAAVAQRPCMRALSTAAAPLPSQRPTTHRVDGP